MDEPTRKQVLDLTAKGFAGTVFLITDDCQASFEEMTVRAVSSSPSQPHQMPYGIDSWIPRPVRQQRAADPTRGHLGHRGVERVRITTAALASAAFFAVAPGTFVGLGPWLITRWDLSDAARMARGTGR